MRTGSHALTCPGPRLMVYLESIRYARRVAFRSVVSGQHVPMELTSLGRAYLSTLPASGRNELEAVFRRRRPRSWNDLSAEIDAALASVKESGFCAASWQPEVIAVAAPLITSDMAYAVNVSVLTTDAYDQVVTRLAPKLLTLRDDIQFALERATDADSL